MVRDRKLCMILVMLITLYSSCKRVIGGYGHEINIKGPDQITLLLKPDSSFTFSSWSDITGSQVIRGDWLYLDDTILLRWKGQELSSNNKIISFKEVKSRSIKSERKIVVLDKRDSSTVSGVGIRINESESPQLTNSNGEVLLNQNDPVYSLQLSYLMVDESIAVENGLADTYLIFLSFGINRIQSYKLYSKWLLHRGGIIPVTDQNINSERGVLKKRYYKN